MPISIHLGKEEQALQVSQRETANVENANMLDMYGLCISSLLLPFFLPDFDRDALDLRFAQGGLK